MTNLHETDDGFVPSDPESEEFCRQLTKKFPPYDEDTLQLLGFVIPSLQVTRKDDQNDPI